MNTTMTKNIQQTAIVDTKQLLLYIKPISERMYWTVLAKDPRFPKPLAGGKGCKALHSVEAIDNYLREVARTGFIQPVGAASDHEHP